MGVVNQKFETLFPRAGALGCVVCFAPHRSSWFICVRMWGHRVLPATLSPALSVYLYANVGPQCLLVVRLPAPFFPHSASLGPTTRVLSIPMPISAPPTGLDECFFFISLVSDFFAVQFSVSSACARRRSVSTYASIFLLVFLNILY